MPKGEHCPPMPISPACSSEQLPKLQNISDQAHIFREAKPNHSATSRSRYFSAKLDIGHPNKCNSHNPPIPINGFVCIHLDQDINPNVAPTDQNSEKVSRFTTTS